jgi:hypothetical protein
MQDFKTRQKLEDDGRVAGVTLLPRQNEQLAQRTRRFCMKRHATTLLAEEPIFMEKQRGLYVVNL